MSIELAKKIGASFQDNFVYFDFQQLEAYDKALTKDESFVIYVDAGWKYNWQESTDREIELNKEIERLKNLLPPNVQIEASHSSSGSHWNDGLGIT